MENSVYFYLFVSVATFQISVQIQFALKILKMRIKKKSSLAIVITEFDAIDEYNYGVVILL